MEPGRGLFGRAVEGADFELWPRTRPLVKDSIKLKHEMITLLPSEIWFSLADGAHAGARPPVDCVFR